MPKCTFGAGDVEDLHDDWNSEVVVMILGLLEWLLMGILKSKCFLKSVDCFLKTVDGSQGLHHSMPNKDFGNHFRPNVGNTR